MMDKEQNKLSQDQERALLETALEQFRDAYEIEKEEIVLADRDIQFAHNENNYQWDPAVKKQREEDTPPRPCLSINKIPEKIDQVDGEFRQLKPAFKVHPVDSVSDPVTADIYAGIIRHIEWNSTARTAYNTAYNSTIHCGRGAWRIDIVDCEEDPFVKEIKISRMPNALAIITDPGAKEQDKSDADYKFVIEEMTLARFKVKYPDIDPGSWEKGNELYQGWISDKNIRIAEYWYKEQGKEKFYKVERDVNGMNTVLTVNEKGRLDTDIVIEEKEVSRPQVKWCKMICNKIIDGPHSFPSKYIPIIEETGKEVFIKGRSKKRGMVRHAIAPAQMYNYWSSAQTETIAMQPKAPYMVTANMIKNYKTIWDSANIKNYPYLPWEPDPQAPGLSPKREPPPQMSVAMAAELNRMAHDIMSAMGIYQASLGDAGQEKSGIAIARRQAQGSTGSYTFVDNFGVAYIHSMKVIIDLIPYVYDTERIQRIRGEDDKQLLVPINARKSFAELHGFEQYQPGSNGYVNDLNAGKYDIVVTIGPSFATQREEINTMMGEIIKSMPPHIASILIKTFFKTLDIPGMDKIVEEIDAAMASGNQPSFEQQLAMKKLELAGLEEMRKSFESKIEAMSKLMHAEAAERGQQLAEISAFVQALSKRMEMDTGQMDAQGGMM